MNYKGLSQHIDFNSLPNPEDRFELLHVIGEGTYGKCFFAKGASLFHFAILFDARERAAEREFYLTFTAQNSFISTHLARFSSLASQIKLPVLMLQ